MGDPQRTHPRRSIADHGVIGNLHTIALVASDGAIDFLCWPQIDSPTVFAALLDPENGGEFSIEPQLDGARVMQDYIPDTNVLLTRWLSDSGSAELVDFMPHPDVSDEGCVIVRRLRATRGKVSFRIRCEPRLDYARTIPVATLVDEAVIFQGVPTLRLQGPRGWKVEGGSAQITIDLDCGQECRLILSDGTNPPPDAAFVASLQDATVREWRRWTEVSHYRGRWREQVTRSALVLKLLTSHRHGSIAAAGTFGLPEATGDQRNWDYRATWIRDASFTAYAFLRLGHRAEAEKFRAWLGTRAHDAADLRIMYAIDGGEAADEQELSHLSGYDGARPVRIGNAAHAQVQLDVFGEAIDSLYLLNKYGTASSHQEWQGLVKAVDVVSSRWKEADAGIWEFRDHARHLLHSRLMCWVAVDRAVRLAHKRSFPAPLERWRQTRDAIAEDIWANFRHPDHGWFVQEKGGTTLDAACLMMPLVRFVSATDPVWLSTLDAIGKHLTDDGMVWRYRNDDGLSGGEGAFTACMFWFVECLARAGRHDEARLEMTKCLGYANRLGLFSEELDRTGAQLGNFPQALTHLAFISAAFFLDRALDGSVSAQWQP